MARHPPPPPPQPSDLPPESAEQSPVAPFRVSRAALTALNDSKDNNELRNRFGGVEVLAAALCTDLRTGISTGSPAATATGTSGAVVTATHGSVDTHPPGGGGGDGGVGGGGGSSSGGIAGGKNGDSGLTVGALVASSLAERQAVFGSNHLPPVPLKSLLALMWGNLQDPILLLLIAAALVSTVLGAAIPEQRAESGWVEGVAIWVAIAVVVLVSSFNDYSKDRQFAALNRQKDLTQVTVVRDGADTRLPNTEVVVGDLLIISSGDKVVADGLLAVPGRDRGGLLALDESSLTGESEPVKKTLDGDPWVRCGTQVQEGGGSVLVLAVGPDTEYGRTMAIVGAAGGEDTPLTDKLGDLAGAIGKIGAAAAIVLFVVLLVIWIVRNRGFPIKRINDNGPVQFFLYCVTIVVVAVPEGLPLAVTLSLAYSMRQMMDDQCFVRVLEACETMGGCTAICSDKTGTLTQNRMTVVEGWLAPGTKFARAPAASELPAPLLQDLQLNIALNSRAFLVEPLLANQPGGGVGGGGGRGPGSGGVGKKPLLSQPVRPSTLAEAPDGVDDIEMGRYVRHPANAASGTAPPPPPAEVAPPRQLLRHRLLDFFGKWSRRGGGAGGSAGADSPVSVSAPAAVVAEPSGPAAGSPGLGGNGGGGVADGMGGAGGFDGFTLPPRLGFVGNRTECALLALMDYGWRIRHYGDVRREYESALTHVYTFTSERKMSAVVVRREDGRLRLYDKGAAEWVLRACTAVQSADGKSVVPLDERRRREVAAMLDEMTGRGLRCIAMAIRDLDPDPPGGRPPGFWDEPPAEEMTLQALFGIKDPVRPEVPAAVATCQRAGITVRMVTGDNINTARFIARECGILRDHPHMQVRQRDTINTQDEKDSGVSSNVAKDTSDKCTSGPTDTASSSPSGGEGDRAPRDGGGDSGGGGGGLAMEGPAFRAMSDEEVAATLPRLQVLARSSPSDKFRLVSALKARREVVAVTGDGTNDAPALKESDVGLAMGITGTEVAKEAADIVVLDDNFSTIVKAVLWGRTVFENIRKFVAFQLTVNIVALVIAFVGAIAGEREPLTVLQLLWVNLIMDTLAALALATERPDPQILDRKPYGRHEHLITPTMLRYMLSQAAYQLAVLFFLLYGLPVVLPKRYGTAVDPDHVRSLSLLFNTFIFCQIFNEINSRRISDELNVFARLHRSPIFIAVLAVTFGAQIIIIELLGNFFDVEPLSWQEWLVSIALGAVALPLSTAVRLVGRAMGIRHRRREAVVGAALGTATDGPTPSAVVGT